MTMLTSKAKLFANTTTKLGLATTIAVLWMAAVPFAARLPPAIRSVRHARRPCKRAAPSPTSGVMHIGPAWPNVAKQINRAKRVDGLIANRSREKSSTAACRYSDREHLILTYHTDRAELVS
jgi:hypothetical protein